jgi:MFS family permease
MAWGWLRVIETIGDLVDVGRKVRRATSAVTGDGGEIQRTEPQGGLTSALGQMETRLTGVLIGALQEAFDRDRARLDLERERVDEERRRAQEALRLEAERLAAERALAERRLTMIAALALWITSAAVAAFLPGMRATVARVPLGLGWASIIGAIAFATASRGPAAQGFLLAGFALIALAIVLAL